jgi:hypothetical protein
VCRGVGGNEPIRDNKPATGMGAVGNHPGPHEQRFRSVAEDPSLDSASRSNRMHHRLRILRHGS